MTELEDSALAKEYRRTWGVLDFTPTSWDKNHNPAYVEWTKAMENADYSPRCLVENRRARDEVISRYGFAIPTRKALRLIQVLSPRGVFEIGAGTGYWAHLLSKLGVNVLACDIGLRCYMTQFNVGDFFNVQPDTYESIMDGNPAVHERTLLMVWPDYDNKAVFDRYRGSTVIYVGEIGEGCTGYDPRVEEKWKLAKVVKIPVWMGIHDSMGIFRRR